MLHFDEFKMWKDNELDVLARYSQITVDKDEKTCKITSELEKETMEALENIEKLAEVDLECCWSFEKLEQEHVVCIKRNLLCQTSKKMMYRHVQLQCKRESARKKEAAKKILHLPETYEFGITRNKIFASLKGEFIPNNWPTMDELKNDVLDDQDNGYFSSWVYHYSLTNRVFDVKMSMNWF